MGRSRRSEETDWFDRVAADDPGAEIDRGTESARVARSAAALVVCMVLTGLVWGVSLAVWATTGPTLDGSRARLGARGWGGGLLIGMVYGLGIAAVLIVPVVIVAALAGGRLMGRRRAQHVTGAVCGLVAVLLGAMGMYWLVPEASAVAEVSWAPLLVAVALAAWWTPWVIDGLVPLGRRSR